MTQEWSGNSYWRVGNDFVLRDASQTKHRTVHLLSVGNRVNMWDCIDGQRISGNWTESQDATVDLTLETPTWDGVNSVALTANYVRFFLRVPFASCSEEL